ncbi:hypothetical protein BJ165DRAFT_924606 [Panaeolus papilionaceus]|nr:hypothetical protein BJ165DRAFT_924606 [Panaeolus papilionaceus]
MRQIINCVKRTNDMNNRNRPRPCTVHTHNIPPVHNSIHFPLRHNHWSHIHMINTTKTTRARQANIPYATSRGFGFFGSVEGEVGVEDDEKSRDAYVGVNER